MFCKRPGIAPGSAAKTLRNIHSPCGIADSHFDFPVVLCGVAAFMVKFEIAHFNWLMTTTLEGYFKIKSLHNNHIFCQVLFAHLCQQIFCFSKVYVSFINCAVIMVLNPIIYNLRYFIFLLFQVFKKVNWH